MIDAELVRTLRNDFHSISKTLCYNLADCYRQIIEKAIWNESVTYYRYQFPESRHVQELIDLLVSQGFKVEKTWYQGMGDILIIDIGDSP